MKKAIKKEDIIRFEKVTFTEFKKACESCNLFEMVTMTDQSLRNVYDNIKLPTRGTSGSAGYDFVTPIDISCEPLDIIILSSGSGIYMFSPKSILVVSICKTTFMFFPISCNPPSGIIFNLDFLNISPSFFL